MSGQHRGKKSPFYIRPGTKQYVYPKAERFKIVKAHLQRDILRGRRPTTVEVVTLAHAAALLVELADDLKRFEEGRKLPADHLRRMQAFRSALAELSPKARGKTGPKAVGSAQDEPIGLADIISGGGS